MTPERNVSLSAYTTFRCGGPAEFFVRAGSVDEIRDAVRFAKASELPVFILGGGSNVLVSDRGFSGVVIKIEMKGIRVVEETEDTVLVAAAAGEEWDSFVESMIIKGWGGVENLSFIPGTVGAAPVQNIGAYGVEAKESIVAVEAFDQESESLITFTNEECAFGYRYSKFKTPEGKRYIVTNVTFRLSKHPTANTQYKDIAEYMAKEKITVPSIRDVRTAVISIRKHKLPDVSMIGTAGSFFKNPIIGRDEYTWLQKKYPELPSFSIDSQKVKVPLAWILDKVCGFRGIFRGEAGVYKNQALVLVNFGGATSDDIKKLAEEMTECVKEKTKIVVEREVEYVGE